MNAMTADVYKNTYWPRLEKAVEQLLTQSPMEYTSISYEQIYSLVYKCVCQQYSEHLYSDLILKITSYLQQVCIKLQDSRPESFVENFNLAFTQYMAAIQCIIPVFIYMNKFYVETKLNRNLKDDLMDLFSAHVAEKHISILISHLKKADAMPFQVNPSTMASVVKGLYALQPGVANHVKGQMKNLENLDLENLENMQTHKKSSEKLRNKKACMLPMKDIWTRLCMNWNKNMEGRMILCR